MSRVRAHFRRDGSCVSHFESHAAIWVRLERSEREYEIARNWIIKNGIPDWRDDSLQLANDINCGQNHYIHQGCTIVALLSLGAKDVRKDNRLLLWPDKMKRRVLVG